MCWQRRRIALSSRSLLQNVSFMSDCPSFLKTILKQYTLINTLIYTDLIGNRTQEFCIRGNREIHHESRNGVLARLWRFHGAFEHWLTHCPYLGQVFVANRKR